MRLNHNTKRVFRLFKLTVLLILVVISTNAQTVNQTLMSPQIPSYELVNDNAKLYLTDVDYSNDTQYLNSFISNYRSNPVIDLTHPIPVSLQWHRTSGYESLKLHVSSDINFSDAWVYSLEPDANSFDVYNLIPNRDYYWKVEGHKGLRETIIESGQFYTTGARRLLMIPGEYLGNCRDLGGLPCTRGTLKFGKLIRGAEVLRDDVGSYMKISDEGIYELKERIGCTVELDFGDLWQESPLEGKGFEVYSDHELYGFYGYDTDIRGLRTTIGRTCLHNCLELIIRKLSEGKSVYFHCNAGADRTGTFAFIIEALCGVDDNDKSKDYELTSLWAIRPKYSNSYSNYINRYRNTPSEGLYGYKSMIEYINSLFSGETLNEKVYDMCTKSIDDGGLGLSVEQILLLRSLLIKKNLTVQSKNYTREYCEDNPLFDYEVEGGTLCGEPEITCEATATSPVGTYDIVVKQGSVSNYNVTYVAGTLTITKAPLTIAAGTYTKKQGEAMPGFTLTYDGFKNDENESVLTTVPTVTTLATELSDPGEYDVLVSGGEAQNYEFSYINGKLIVQESTTSVSEIIEPTGLYDVYTITGMLIKKGTSSFNGLPNGLYVVNRKIIILH